MPSILREFCKNLFFYSEPITPDNRKTVEIESLGRITALFSQNQAVFKGERVFQPVYFEKTDRNVRSPVPFYNPDVDVDEHRQNLPHWQQGGGNLGWGWDKSGIVAVMPLSKDKLQEEKDKFIQARPACALYDSYSSAVRTRNAQFPVFCGNQRREFQDYARHQLREISDRYLNMPDQDRDNWHINNIEELRNALQEEFAEILHEGRMRFGVAQKMLNLYLKHLWVRNCIETPPHCPFDDIILKKLFQPSGEVFIPWTEMDNNSGIGTYEYRRWVCKAREIAQNNGCSHCGMGIG